MNLLKLVFGRTPSLWIYMYMSTSFRRRFTQARKHQNNCHCGCLILRNFGTISITKKSSITLDWRRVRLSNYMHVNNFINRYSKQHRQHMRCEVLRSEHMEWASHTQSEMTMYGTIVAGVGLCYSSKRPLAAGRVVFFHNDNYFVNSTERPSRPVHHKSKAGNPA